MKRLLLIIPLFLSFSLFAQKPCAQPEYRQFDFWLGNWEAFTPKGQKAGDSKISLLLDSCTILEEWTSATVQRGFRYSGKSFNMYNAPYKRWQQYYVDNTGAIAEYVNGHFENGKMILQTNNNKISDTSWKILKMTFYNLGPDKVRQHGESSADGGTTWVTDFDLEYRRKKD